MKNKKSFQPIIKWSGSKRNVAYEIAALAPKSINTYFEPFIGGGSILYTIEAERKTASDINKPLIDLWNLIKNESDFLLKHYSDNWNLLNDEKNPESHKVFYDIREQFNQNFNPEDLFFLSRTCVNGLIRFNKRGEFNNSLHYTRKGINPITLKKIILQWIEKIKYTEFLHRDYNHILDLAKKDDFVYLDPPYFNTKGMYYGTINIDDFMSFFGNGCILISVFPSIFSLISCTFLLSYSD